MRKGKTNRLRDSMLDTVLSFCYLLCLSGFPKELIGRSDEFTVFSSSFLLVEEVMCIRGHTVLVAIYFTA